MTRSLITGDRAPDVVRLKKSVATSVPSLRRHERPCARAPSCLSRGQASGAVVPFVGSLPHQADLFLVQSPAPVTARRVSRFGGGRLCRGRPAGCLPVPVYGSRRTPV